LASLVAAVGFVDDVEPPAPPNHAVIAMAIAERAERILDLHGNASIACWKKGQKQAGNRPLVKPGGP
jgi:hypothetical protein